MEPGPGGSRAPRGGSPTIRRGQTCRVASAGARPGTDIARPIIHAGAGSNLPSACTPVAQCPGVKLNMTTTSFDTMTHEQVAHKIARGESHPEYATTLVKNGVTYYRLFGILYRDTSQAAVLEARRYGYLATKIKVQGMHDVYWDVYAARKPIGKANTLLIAEAEKLLG